MEAGVLGAVLAGGAGTRFGGRKALATVGGRTVLARVLDALRGVADPVLVVANDPTLAEGVVPDDTAGLGPLEGIATALRQARIHGAAGALCVAGDMPFVDARLLAAILRTARDVPGRIVVPESTGRRGYEPLCAYYPAEVLSGLQAALAEGERTPHRFLQRLSVRRLSLAEVRGLGDPEIIFFNVNTQEDLARAQRIAAGEPA